MPSSQAARNLMDDGSFGGAVQYDPAEHFETVLDRMKQAAGVRTQTQLAEVLGVGKAAISDAKRRHVIPASWYIRLSRPPYLINPSWLETGIEPRYIVPPPGAEEEHPNASPVKTAQDVGENRPEGLEPEEYSLVPIVAARPSGGGGSLETEAGVEGYYAFRRNWLERKGNVSSMRLMRVTGDSMQPTINDSDVVLVDESQKDTYEGKIYVIRIDDDIVVKRLGKKPGMLMLISDNRELYDPLEVDLKGGASVAVVGRVIWMAREVM